MQKRLVFGLLSWVLPLLAQDTLIIQEKALGQCTYDGVVVTSSSSISGWTGPGFIDAASGIGTTISWEIVVPMEGDYQITWRYAFGGYATNYRDGRLIIDGNPAVDTVFFPYTGSWSTWQLVEPLRVHLSPGNHKFRLEALWPSGLANIDYFMVVGAGPEAAECTPQYVVSVKSSNPDWGSVWYTPVRDYYDRGTLLTLHARPAAGFFFESWTGSVPSNDSVHTLRVEGNVKAVARFLPEGVVPEPDLIGYAGVQDDRGTTYLVTGGALGDTVVATTLNELQTYLGDSLPHVVLFSGFLTGNVRIPIRSDKTLLGSGTAHLEGIALEINQARNVIIRNITISHVRDTLATNDALEINGGSQNIWVDHCEFYSDREHGKDYYDGLLDVKNGSSFITVSWSVFHDHYKVCLVSSGDEQVIDTVARLTFHHNYFYNCESRLPMIRFGKDHIFNNYYKDCHNAIDSRMGACLKIEGNYFANVYRAVFDQGSTIPGKAFLNANHFGNSLVQSLPECDFPIPYPYQLDSAEAVPRIIAQGLTTKIRDNAPNNNPTRPELLPNHPNPCNQSTVIRYHLPQPGWVSLTIYNLDGQLVEQLVSKEQPAGDYTLRWDMRKVSTGIYFLRLATEHSQRVQKLVVIK